MALIRALRNTFVLNTHLRLPAPVHILANKYSSKQINEEDPGPIQFTTSPASKWTAKISRTGVQNPRLYYEPHITLASISIFLLYFCVLREENDIDKELETSLYSRISGLEEQQLHALKEFNEEKGLETTDIVNRLKELKELEA